MRVFVRRVVPSVLFQLLLILVINQMVTRLHVHLLPALFFGAFVEGLFIFALIYRRRQKIRQLNAYLSSINSGEAKLSFTDFTDGELSILQNELFRLSETLHNQNVQLKQDKQYIQDSLNDLAHQIKTPLTSVVMMFDLLQQEDLPKDKKDSFVESINQQLDRLQGLIQNLLTLSKLEANVINFEPVAIMDNEFIEQLLSGFDVQIEMKNIKLQVETDHQLVNIDVDWTIEALSNIVKNALEHMKDYGTLKIQSSVNLMYWQILIEDDGSGIKKEDLDHIFDRFYRGKTSRKDSVGIGLSLSKRIVNQQRGLIKVESEEEQYTRFIIRFLK